MGWVEHLFSRWDGNVGWSLDWNCKEAIHFLMCDSVSVVQLFSLFDYFPCFLLKGSLISIFCPGFRSTGTDAFTEATFHFILRWWWELRWSFEFVQTWYISKKGFFGLEPCCVLDGGADPRTTPPLPPFSTTFVSLSPLLISAAAAAASAVPDQFKTDYGHRCRGGRLPSASAGRGSVRPSVRPPIPR